MKRVLLLLIIAISLNAGYFGDGGFDVYKTSDGYIVKCKKLAGIYRGMSNKIKVAKINGQWQYKTSIDNEYHTGILMYASPSMTIDEIGMKLCD